LIIFFGKINTDGQTGESKRDYIVNGYQSNKLHKEALPRVPCEFLSEVPLFSFIR